MAAMLNRNSSLLHVENLSAVFKNGEGFKLVNDNVSFSLNKGEWLGIMGISGSGKSVLAKSVSGLLTGTPGIVEGTLSYDGTNLLENLFKDISFVRRNGTVDNVRKKYHSWLKRYRNNFHKHTRNAFAYIFQNPIEAFNPYYTLGRHIKEAFAVRMTASAEIEQASVELIRSLRLSKELLYTYPHIPAGGELQRIAIGMALAQGASIIIADECTTSLDPPNAENVLQLLHEVQKNNGVSIMFITHDEELARKHCDRIYWMHRGKLFYDECAYRVYFKETGTE